MRVPARHRDAGGFDATMTPMIDVVFQLMIFVCTASFNLTEFVLPSRITAQETGGSDAPLDPQEADLERIVLAAAAARRAHPMANERPRLPRRRGSAACSPTPPPNGRYGVSLTELPVIFDIQRPVPLGDIIDVYDVCRLEGYRKLQFAAAQN